MNPTRFLSYLIALSACNSSAAFSAEGSPANKSRRTFLSKFIASPAIIAGAGVLSNPSLASASPKTDALIADLKSSKEKMDPIPALLEANEWDKVRTILKTPPVNSLWNLGDSKNTLVQLAKETGEFELLELKDELALSLQMCDQVTYANAFVAFQPGNGKINIKEPIFLSKKATSQLDNAIELASQ
mmetsp:Transcript_28760/g.43960  ORF Transcript_28760/g.43960 Transcript_28760/m.43960 type:complete len:187 (+) Transcript_28760:93-653(+)